MFKEHRIARILRVAAADARSLGGMNDVLIRASHRNELFHVAGKDVCEFGPLRVARYGRASRSARSLAVSTSSDCSGPHCSTMGSHRAWVCLPVCDIAVRHIVACDRTTVETARRCQACRRDDPRSLGTSYSDCRPHLVLGWQHKMGRSGRRRVSAVVVLRLSIRRPDVCKRGLALGPMPPYKGNKLAGGSVLRNVRIASNPTSRRSCPLCERTNQNGGDPSETTTDIGHPYCIWSCSLGLQR
jgi:hypothetical protein